MISQPRLLSYLTILRHFPHRFTSSHFSNSSASLTTCAIPESAAYLRSMRRAPSTSPSRKQRRNSCSFIGTLHNHVQCSGGSSSDVRAFVSMEVKSDHSMPNSSCFRVCLWMQGELAEISLKHLKPNDFIYVSGTLGSYQKFDANGELQILYKVYVQDLNYVRRPAEHHKTPRPVNMVEETAGESGPMHEKVHLDRMHLWQLFFTCPDEWWDNRLAKKRNPSSPDFKHKDTKECLWLSPDDPPWIRRQLEQYDASIRGGRSKRDANDFWDFEDF